MNAETKQELERLAALAVAEADADRCYCPGDCNCHLQHAPWHRFNFCGCRAHDNAEALS